MRARQTSSEYRFDRGDPNDFVAFELDDLKVKIKSKHQWHFHELEVLDFVYRHMVERYIISSKIEFLKDLERLYEHLRSISILIGRIKEESVSGYDPGLLTIRDLEIRLRALADLVDARFAVLRSQNSDQVKQLAVPMLVLYLLKKHGAMDVKEIAKRLSESHPDHVPPFKTDWKLYRWIGGQLNLLWANEMVEKHFIGGESKYIVGEDAV